MDSWLYQLARAQETGPEREARSLPTRNLNPPRQHPTRGLRDELGCPRLRDDGLGLFRPAVRVLILDGRDNLRLEVILGRVGELYHQVERVLGRGKERRGESFLCSEYRLRLVRRILRHCMRAEHWRMRGTIWFLDRPTVSARGARWDEMWLEGGEGEGLMKCLIGGRRER